MTTVTRDDPPSSPASTATPPVTRWTWPEALGPLLLLLLGTLLLLPGHGLWYDELYTAEVARLPLADILTAVVEGTGTTSYLVVHGWMALPGLGGDTSLRALSLLATAGGLALITRAVTRLAGRATGVLAGCVVACSPLLLEQAVEARSYGLAVLATGGALLGVTRWLQEGRGLVLLGLAGAGMGLAHWYAVTVLAAFVVAAVLLRGRRAVPVVLVGAAAALPTVALVGLNVLTGNGDRNAQHVRDTDGALADLAVRAWTAGENPLLYLTSVLVVVGALRAAGVRVVAAAWVLVPLLLLSAAEVVRPVYFPRYLLAGLVGVGVLAAAGVQALPRPVRAPVAALLLACSLLASQPLLDRGPRESSDELVRSLAQMHEPGEPVVAADTRSAIGLDHYVRTLAPGLRPDVVLPPGDASVEAERIWLVRRLVDGVPVRTDDDAILAAGGFRLVDQGQFPGSKTHLVLQRWER